MKKLLCLFALFSNTITFAMLPLRKAPLTDRKTILINMIISVEQITEQLLQEQLHTINQQDNSGRTALHHAAAQDRIDIVRLLVTNKADRTIKDNEGKTAEDIALERKKMRAQSENRSYEHHDYQEASTPAATIDSTKPEISLLHNPNQPITLSKETQETPTSPGSSPTFKKHNPGYTSYADLI